MGYPSLETVQVFKEISERDGIEEITENLFGKYKDRRMTPLLMYFKLVLTQMLENDLIDEANGYSNGFISCVDMFRRQINCDMASLDDLTLQIDNMANWINFLESEVATLKNKIYELEN